MKSRRGYNPKRRILAAGEWSEEKLKAMAEKASYGGNPEHKSRPNDYQLKPPANPRPGKTLCDEVSEFPKLRAQNLLCAAFLRGMVSVQERDGWPQSVWAVCEDEAYEAQLENRAKGVYHGYPMPAQDNFRDVVLKEWSRRERKTDH